MGGWLRSVARGLVSRRRLEREMAEELQTHIEMRAADLAARGMPAAQARRTARLEFGAIEARKDDCRRALFWHLADDLAADLRYAWRRLRNSPGFVIVAVVTLALGIGVNTTVFSVVNSAVLQPLPVPGADRLVFLETAGGGNSHSFPTYRDLRDRTHALGDLFGYRIAFMQTETDAGPVRAWGYLVTGNYFDALGVEPAAGRFFHAEDDGAPGASPFVVLSYEMWQRRFAGAREIVGSQIRINKLPYTVLGIAPRGFFGTEVFYHPELWVPMAMQPLVEPGNPWLDKRTTHNTLVGGRLADGVSMHQAEVDLNIIGSDLARAFPDQKADLTFTLTVPGWLGSMLGRPVRAFLTGLLVLSGLVLLVACANLSSHLLSHSEARRHEFAVRVAIGAGWSRLARQLVTESLLLATFAGLAGYALTAVVARALSDWQLLTDIPLRLNISPEPRVHLFAALVTATAGLLLSAAPVLKSWRVGPSGVLRDDGIRHTRPARLHAVLVVGQVALCFVVISASVVSLRGLRAMLEQPIGFEPDGLFTAGVDVSQAGYTREDAERFHARLIEEVGRLPDVRSAAYTSELPLTTGQSSSTVRSELERNDQLSKGHEASHFQVSPGFFSTMGIPLLTGRAIEARDTTERPRVAVVNETFARAVFGVDAASAVGRRFVYGRQSDPIEVVGIVRDGRYRTLTEAPQPAVFVSLGQTRSADLKLIVRSSRPAASLDPEVRRVVSALDPQLPITDVGSARSRIAFALLPSQAAAAALTTSGLLAIVLAGTGVYGLAALAAARRRRELAIRKALGATSRALVGTIALPAVRLLTVGCAIGAALSLVTGRLLSAVVLNTAGGEGLTLAVTTAVLGALGLAGVALPTLQVMRMDPIPVLQQDSTPGFFGRRDARNPHKAG